MNMKRVLSVLLLSILLFSFVFSLSVGFVSANGGQEEGVVKTLWGSFLNKFNSFGLDSFQDNYSEKLAPFLISFLVVLLVYSISDFIPVLPANSQWIKWTFSFIFGVLAFLFIKSGIFVGIAQQYAIVSILMTSVMPLLILIAFSYKIRENDKYNDARGKVIFRFIDRVLFIGFIVLQIYYLIRGGVNDQVSFWFRITYAGTIGIAGIWTWNADSFYIKISEAVFHEDLKQYGEFQSNLAKVRLGNELANAYNELMNSGHQRNSPGYKTLWENYKRLYNKAKTEQRESYSDPNQASIKPTNS